MGGQPMSTTGGGPVVTEYEWAGPKRGADRAVLLAHGAGSDMNGAALVAVADALAEATIPSLRFNFPYRTAGRKAPDRPKVLDASVREAAAELARRAKLPNERLVLGGRSMGGRYCSMAVGDADDPLPALGLVLLS
jgi:predicted alpha/beta-hydrolase family hydrolase